MTGVVRWALDQNFPEPILNAFKLSMPPSIELEPVRLIDDRLASLDDWKLLVALMHRRRVGLVTCDSEMLNLPREMCALERTGLALVVADAAGHDPIVASGLILTHIDWISKKVAPGTPQIFHLRRGTPEPRPPGDQLNRIANHRNVSTGSLRDDAELSPGDLVDPLSG